jgi:hypothetical protein
MARTGNIRQKSEVLTAIEVHIMVIFSALNVLIKQDFGTE